MKYSQSIVAKAAEMGLVAKEASFDELNNTFAEACVNTNTLAEILIEASKAQDASADMETWGLDPEEYAHQLRIAIQHLLFLQQEAQSPKPLRGNGSMY